MIPIYFIGIRFVYSRRTVNARTARKSISVIIVPGSLSLRLLILIFSLPVQ